MTRSPFDLQEELAMVEKINAIRQTIHDHCFCDIHPDKKAHALIDGVYYCEACWEVYLVLPR